MTIFVVGAETASIVWELH